MRTLRNRANETLATEQQAQKRNGARPPGNQAQNDDCSEPIKTTTHRYLLSRALAVNTTIDWRAKEANSEATEAFFRALACRLIGVH